MNQDARLLEVLAVASEAAAAAAGALAQSYGVPAAKVVPLTREAFRRGAEVLLKGLDVDTGSVFVRAEDGVVVEVTYTE